MTRYELIMASLKAHIAQYDRVEVRGKNAIQSLVNHFVQYLELPPNTAYCIDDGARLDSKPIPMPMVGALQDDGWFSGTVVIKENAPLGAMIGVTFFVFVDEEWFRIKSRDGIECRVKAFDKETLVPYFEELLKRLLEVLDARPIDFTDENTQRPIGFIWHRD